MSASFYDLLKFAKTGIASPDMTHYDKLKALSMCKAGFPVKTLTGVPPITFQSDGTPLTAWSISGNMVQNSVPSPDNPVQPQECGDKTGNLFDDATATYGKYINSEGVEAVSSSGVTNHSDYSPVQENTSYTIAETKPIYSGITSAIAWYDADKQFIVRNSYSAPNNEGRFSWTAVSPNSAAFAIINFTRYPDYDGENDMLNTGSTALPYEPFGFKIQITLAGQTQNIYLSEPLRKALDGSDAVDVLRSDGTLTREVDSSGNALTTPTTETVTVPTLTPTKGSNTLSVGTTLQPSEISITGGIK